MSRTLAFDAVEPSEKDVEVAEESVRALSRHVPRYGEQTIKIAPVGATPEEVIELPTVAFRLLIDILEQMARGNVVALTPIHAEMTTQEAATLLGVSRPFLIKLLDSGEIPHRKVGTHRRIRFSDLRAYKHRSDERRRDALAELVRLEQELGLGYE